MTPAAKGNGFLQLPYVFKAQGANGDPPGLKPFDQINGGPAIRIGHDVGKDHARVGDVRVEPG